MLDSDGKLRDDLWAPSCWRAAHGARPALTPAEVAVLALLVLWNVLSNEVLPELSYVPANIGIGVVLVLLARRSGVTWDMMGLRSDRIGRGIAVGLVAVAVIAVAVAVALAIPAARGYFEDRRFVGVGGGEVLYEVLLRIPIGTAVFEELAFRGVLFALLLRRMSVLGAATISAVLFGLWHVLPTLDALETNPAGELARTPSSVAALVAGGVLLLTAIGYAFTWLRLRGNSLIAPILAHAAANGFGYLAGWLVMSRV